jgi:two-component system, NtrC family, response regulator AtoC
MIEQYIPSVVTYPRDIPNGAEKLASARILVVDDERLVRWAVGETLRSQGYEIVEAADAESARRAILSDAPDLVLLDLRLPDSDDLGLVFFIRAHVPQTPVVLMTAFGTSEILAQAVALGVVILAKPFDINELTWIVESTVAPRVA